MKKAKPKSLKPKSKSQKPNPNSKKIWKFARYLPAIVISLFAFSSTFLPGINQGSGGNQAVLAYATNVSISGLLSYTNKQRSNYAAASLKLNSKLNSAAQAKANDMVARDYWSHQTPDGDQPWVFITNAGYKYLSAGENLAYGFLTSSDTVTGWMNSPSHKANLINTKFTEVGFGFANSTNFVGDGKETVVVAMYGKPQVASTSTGSSGSTKPSSPSPVTKVTKPKAEPVAKSKAAETPIVEQPKEPAAQEPISTSTDSSIQPALTATTSGISRVQIITNGNATWSAMAVILAVCSVGVLWAMHKGFRAWRYVMAGEHFVVNHLHLDLTVLSVVYFGFVMLSNSGVVR